MVTFVLATTTGVVVLAVREAGIIGFLALAVVATGAVAARWWRWVGICVAAAGPVLTTFSHSGVTSSGAGSETVLVWSLMVFTAFFWALRGTRAIPLGLIAGVGSAVAFGLETPLGWLDPLVGAALATAFAAAFAGGAISTQRRYLAEAEGRRREVKLTREAEIQRRIAQERLRIARDLHDMVGHQTAVVSMHLGAAELHVRSDPGAAATDLAAARGGVQAVLRETQRILEVLRAGPGEDDLIPLADQAHLEALVQSFRDAGVSIDAKLDQLPGDATGDVGAAVYRAVQEALTNAQKHGTGTASVQLSVQQPRIELTVTNPIRTRKDRLSSGGYGLVGMRERVSAAGGTMHVTTEHEQFIVQVSLRGDGRTIT